MPEKLSFPRIKYSLKRKKQIEKLLSSGEKILEYPILIKWSISEKQDSPFKVAFIISKRKVNKATKRNLIRRRLRESLRAIKHLILSKIPDDIHISVLIIYLASQPLPYSVISEKIKTIFSRLLDQNFNIQKK